jgi:hypothetical protein
MKKLCLLMGLVVGAVASGQAFAEAGKTLKFWNLTADTITELYAQPAGKNAWSANLCLSDPDKSVDPDERLSLPGFAPGTYDVRIVDKGGRQCLFHNVAVRADGPYAFSIAEDQMKGCTH